MTQSIEFSPILPVKTLPPVTLSEEERKRRREENYECFAKVIEVVVGTGLLGGGFLYLGLHCPDPLNYVTVIGGISTAVSVFTAIFCLPCVTIDCCHACGCCTTCQPSKKKSQQDDEV